MANYALVRGPWGRYTSSILREASSLGPAIHPGEGSGRSLYSAFPRRDGREASEPPQLPLSRGATVNGRSGLVARSPRRGWRPSDPCDTLCSIPHCASD